RGQGLNVVGADDLAVLRAEEVFQQYFQCIGEAGRLGKGLLDRTEAENGVIALAHAESRLAGKGVGHGWGPSLRLSLPIVLVSPRRASGARGPRAPLARRG